MNPAHLFLGTVKDNNADCKAKGRNAAGDKNGSRKFPLRRPSGASHWWAKGKAHHAVGTKNGRAKLTESQVRQIRQAWESGTATVREMRVQFSISETLVRKIISRQLWAHVD